jgi:hypothetical protein
MVQSGMMRDTNLEGLIEDILTNSKKKLKMNIELLGRNAINKIKETLGNYQKGFLAGGSISNLIWEEISGNKSIINDIDIFIDEILELQPQVRNKELYSFLRKK